MIAERFVELMYSLLIVSISSTEHCNRASLARVVLLWEGLLSKEGERDHG